jgi:hypothetical protein
VGSSPDAGLDNVPDPRADYEKTLRITPQGCFVMETQLADATLGQGNQLTVRAWGALRAEKSRPVVATFDTRSAQAVGSVCGHARVIDLARGKFLRPRYEVSVEADVLTLTAQTESQQTFQFKRRGSKKR